MCWALWFLTVHTYFRSVGTKRWASLAASLWFLKEEVVKRGVGTYTGAHKKVSGSIDLNKRWRCDCFNSISCADNNNMRKFHVYVCWLLYANNMFMWPVFSIFALLLLALNICLLTSFCLCSVVRPSSPHSEVKIIQHSLSFIWVYSTVKHLTPKLWHESRCHSQSVDQ